MADGTNDFDVLAKAFGEHADATTEAMREQKARLEELESTMKDEIIAIKRAGFGAAVHGGGGDEKVAAERKALATFARTGDDAEMKNMNVTASSDGGYTVLENVDRTIRNRLFELSPIARLARQEVITTGGAFDVITDIADYGAEWVGEADTRSSTSGSTFERQSIALDECFANVSVTQRLLDDAGFDIGAHVEERIADKFARAIGTALTVGDGVAKPTGLATYSSNTSSDADRAWGTVEHVITGADTGFIATSSSAGPADCLIDMQTRLKSGHRANGAWLMNARTAGIVRKFRDLDGRFLWQDQMMSGEPALLLGHPVYIADDMDDVASGNMPIAFGDVRAAYTYVSRPGLKLLRDPYTDRPNVQFYAYTRAGGALVNSEAVKFLRVSS
jgi:HK97 family phage major capsid protein